MRKLLAVFAVAAVAVAVFLAPGRADAGPVLKAQLVSVDAGCTQVVQIQAKSCYCVQAKYNQTCIKLNKWDGGFQSYGADCTKDWIISTGQAATVQTVTPGYCFDSAGNTAVVACNLDAGPSNTNLFTLESNPVNPAGCTTLSGGNGF